MADAKGQAAQQVAKPQIAPCRYKTGKTLGAGSYSVVKECVHIDTGRYYAAKVINKRMMAGREHMVGHCLVPFYYCKGRGRGMELRSWEGRKWSTLRTG